MRDLFWKMKTKLNMDSGESIAEVLIAMLIIELALIMVVSMIMSAGKIIKKSEASFNYYYAEKNAMETNTPQTAQVNGETVTVSPVPGSARITVSDALDTTIATTDVNVRKLVNGGSVDLEIYEPITPTPTPSSPPAGG